MLIRATHSVGSTLLEMQSIPLLVRGNLMSRSHDFVLNSWEQHSTMAVDGESLLQFVKRESDCLEAIKDLFIWELK